jgi:hypothetical protein
MEVKSSFKPGRSFFTPVEVEGVVGRLSFAGSLVAGFGVPSARVFGSVVFETLEAVSVANAVVVLAVVVPGVVVLVVVVLGVAVLGVVVVVLDLVIAVLVVSLAVVLAVVVLAAVFGTFAGVLSPEDSVTKRTGDAGSCIG